MYFNETDNARELKVLILGSSHALISNVLKQGGCVNLNSEFEDREFRSLSSNLILTVF